MARARSKKASRLFLPSWPLAQPSRTVISLPSCHRRREYVYYQAEDGQPG